MTALSASDRDKLLKQFSRAILGRDADALYACAVSDFIWRLPVGPAQPVAREIRSRDELEAYFAERGTVYETMRFDDVTYYHAPEATFMTFRASGKRRSGEMFNVLGMERYLFRNRLVALKDAYWKRIEQE